MRNLTVGKALAVGVAVAILGHVGIYVLASVGFPGPLLEMFFWPGFAVPVWYWGGVRENPVAALIGLVLNVLFWTILFAVATWIMSPPA